MQQECQRGAGRDQIEIGAHGRSCAGHDGGHPHVLGAAERHRGPQHRQPQEQDGGQFVRPDQRAMQPVTRHHASEQDDDLGHDQKRCRDLNQHSQDMFEGRQSRTAARGLSHLAGHKLDQFGISHNEPLHSGRDPGTRYDSLPADFSSSAQAWSPYLPFHSA